jgi:hypothetical protein
MNDQIVYGECGKHPGNSYIDCVMCFLEKEFSDDRKKLRDDKINEILKENELHRGKDSKEGKS